MHHPKRDHFAELRRNTFFIGEYGLRFDHDLEAVYQENWKLIRDDKGQRCLFDLGTDPLEENNLADSNMDKVNSLTQRLTAWELTAASTQLSAPQVELRPQLKERLRALGYMGDK